MREELHLMELVDRYLDGGMGEMEGAEFEERLRTNAELRSAVDDQRALREGLRRVLLRGALSSAHRRWSGRRWLPWAAVGLLVIATAAWMMSATTEQHTPSQASNVRTNEQPAHVSTGTDDVRTDPMELNTRVESVFMQTKTVDKRMAETFIGEGRIVTHLIQEKGTVRPEASALSPIEVDVNSDSTQQARLSTTTDQEYERDDRSPRSVKVDPLAAPEQEEQTLLARVERLENATKPEYPGGMEEMQCFLEGNVRQPRGTRESGTVAVSFTVNKQGEVTNARVVRSMGRAFDDEALRAVSLMPLWKPSLLGDRPVKSSVEVPIRFDGKPDAREKREKRGSKAR